MTSHKRFIEVCFRSCFTISLCLKAAVIHFC